MLEYFANKTILISHILLQTKETFLMLKVTSSDKSDEIGIRASIQS